MQDNLRPLRPLSRTQESRRRAADRLRVAIDGSGLNCEQVAGLLGCDRRQVRRWVNGEVPLGPLELLVELEAAAAKRRAA